MTEQNNFGIEPNIVKGNFLPEIESKSLPNLELSSFGSFNTKPVISPDLFSNNNDLFNKLSEPSFERNLQGQSFDYEALNPNRYKNAEQFQRYGLDLSGNNNEELYGNLQTRWNKIGNALIGAGKLAKNQFIDQLTSWDDTFDILTNNPVFKQEELEQLSKTQQDLFDNNPIFQTQKDRDTFFNFSNLANMVQQSGYAVGAIGEIMLEEFVMSALTTATFGATAEAQASRTISLIDKLGKASKNTLKGVESLQEVSKLRKLFNGLGKNAVRLVNPLENVLDFGTNAGRLAAADRLVYGATKGLARTTARGFGAFYRDVRLLNAAIAEATAEAATTQSDLLKELKNDYYNKTGIIPQGLILEELKNKAYEAAKTNGIANTVLIMATNKIAFDGVLKNFKPLRFSDDALISKGLYLNSKKAIKKGEDVLVEKTGFYKPFIHNLRTRPLKTVTIGIADYTKSNLIEGVQEVGQSISGGAVNLWYQSKYGLLSDRDRVNSEWDAIKKSAEEQYSMEGSKTFFSGFLTGSIINTLGKTLSGSKDLIAKYQNPEAYNKKQEELNKQRQELKTNFSNFYKDPASYVNVISNINDAMVITAKNGSKKQFLDLKGDNTRHFILNSIRSGTIDMVVDRFKDFSENLSPEEFKQAFKTSILDNLSQEDAKLKIRELTKEFSQRVDSIKNTYLDLSNKYPNPYNPYKFKDKEEMFEEFIKYKAHQEALEQISFSKDLYIETGVRQADILKNLNNKIQNLPFTTLLNLTNNVDNLKDEIKRYKDELEVTDDATIKKEKQDTINSLTYYSELTQEYFKVIKQDNLSDEEYIDIKKEFSEKIKPLIKKLVSIDNKINNLDNLDEESLSEVVYDITDFLELNSDKKEALNYFNTVFNPNSFDSLIGFHIENLSKIIKHDESRINDNTTVDGTKTTDGESVGTTQTNTQTENTELEVTLTNKDGSKQTLLLKPNQEYITEANPTTKKIGDKEVKIYDQQYFKINSIDGNNIVLSQNTGESIIFTKEEFENTFNKLTDITNKSAIVKIYFKNRDTVIKLAVNKKTGKLHVLNDTTYSKDVTVHARLNLINEAGTYKLYINYINPISGELEKVEYNEEYVTKYDLGKADLKNFIQEEKRNESELNLNIVNLENKKLQEIKELEDSLPEIDKKLSDEDYKKVLKKQEEYFTKKEKEIYNKYEELINIEKQKLKSLDKPQEELKPVVDNIELKKADIERRRQEELKKAEEQRKPKIDELKQKAEEDIKRTGYVQKITRDRLDSQEGLLFLDKDKINAKYDAELATLNNTQQQEVINKLQTNLKDAEKVVITDEESAEILLNDLSNKPLIEQIFSGLLTKEQALQQLENEGKKDTEEYQNINNIIENRGEEILWGDEDSGNIYNNFINRINNAKNEELSNLSLEVQKEMINLKPEEYDKLLKLIDSKLKTLTNFEVIKEGDVLNINKNNYIIKSIDKDEVTVIKYPNGKKNIKFNREKVNSANMVTEDGIRINSKEEDVNITEEVKEAADKTKDVLTEVFNDVELLKKEFENSNSDSFITFLNNLDCK